MKEALIEIGSLIIACIFAYIIIKTNKKIEEIKYEYNKYNRK